MPAAVRPARALRDVLMALSLVACFGGASATGRDVRFNGRPLDEAGQRTLAMLEARIGAVPPGQYWYDPRSGAAGPWGGPVVVFLAPALPLGGPLPPQASGGGSGQLTGVFVNRRELHPVDVQRLLPLIPVRPGHYWWDAGGNVGVEGGPALFNINQLRERRAQQDAAPGTHHRRDLLRGESTTVTRGCAAVSGRLRASDHDSSYSYYVGC